MPVGKLESADVRELWKHEEYGFSVWLEKNIELLSEKLRISFSGVQREKVVGSFRVDLVAEDDDGKRIIIENQLEETNHDHLGKLLTYFTNLDAKIAIWITTEPRPEHIRAVAWLNEVTPEDIGFYLVRIEAYRIGDSDPAPLFTVICKPDKETKEIEEDKKDAIKQHELNRKFWEQLLARAEEKGVTLHSSRFPIKGDSLNVNAGRPGLTFSYVIWPEDEQSAVSLWIESKDKNKYIFDLLYANRKKIEADFGKKPDWERCDERRYSFIRHYFHDGPMKDKSNWVHLQDNMIDAMDRLSKALKPHIEELPDLATVKTQDIKPPIKVDYKKFWGQLLALAKQKSITLHANCSVSDYNDRCFTIDAGKTGLHYEYAIWPEHEEASVYFYIGIEDKNKIKHIFDLFYADKEKIEADFGEDLVWDLPGNRRYSMIQYTFEVQNLEDENNWASIQDTMICAMDRLSKALKPHIQALLESL